MTDCKPCAQISGRKKRTEKRNCLGCSTGVSKKKKLWMRKRRGVSEMEK